MIIVILILILIGIGTMIGYLKEISNQNKELIKLLKIGEIMMLKNENDIIACIREDQWMMDVLTHVKALNLPDWWVCAGFVRSKIWDVIHNFSGRTDLPDVDVIYYDTRNISIEKEKELERQLKLSNAQVPWSVKNQARMHLENGRASWRERESIWCGARTG